MKSQCNVHTSQHTNVRCIYLSEPKFASLTDINLINEKATGGKKRFFIFKLYMVPFLNVPQISNISSTGVLMKCVGTYVMGPTNKMYNAAITANKLHPVAINTDLSKKQQLHSFLNIIKLLEIFRRIYFGKFLIILQ